MEPNIKNMAINHIMRNIDMEVSKEDEYGYLFTLNVKEELIYIIIAASIRSVRDTIHVYFCEEMNVLEPLPLSLNSYCMAMAEKYNILAEYKITAEEDVEMQLNISECKKFIKDVSSFINENAESLTEKLLSTQNRNCEFTIVSNS